MIYNQRKIPREQWRYGFRASADVGCGWVAVYNALCVLGKEQDVPELIRMFERQVPLVNGALGSFVGSAPMALHKLGYDLRVSNERSRYDELAKEAPVCVLSYYWRKKYRVGAHFVALRWTGDHFEGYNTFANSRGPDNYGPSLDGFLKRHGYFATVLTCVFEPGTMKKEKE